MFESSYMIHCFHVHIIDVRMQKCYFRNARMPRDLSCPRVEVSASQILLETPARGLKLLDCYFEQPMLKFQ